MTMDTTSFFFFLIFFFFTTGSFSVFKTVMMHVAMYRYICLTCLPTNQRMWVSFFVFFPCFFFSFQNLCNFLCNLICCVELIETLELLW